jgi:FkbM family methyltransferase
MTFNLRILTLLAEWLSVQEDPLLFYLKYINLPKSVLHCGSHLAQEAKIYKDNGVNDVWYVEAQSEICTALRSSFGSDRIFEGALWSQEGLVKDFYITNNELSSSMYEINENIWNVKNTRIEKVSTITLSGIFNQIRNDFGLVPELLILDLQGAELEAIRGGSDEIRNIKHLLVEVSTTSLYKEMPLYNSVDMELRNLKFLPIREFISSKSGHGEVIYSREKLSLTRRIRLTFIKLLYPKVKLLYFFLRKFNHKIQSLF